ncbi:MAG: nucleotidyltransferase family protein [Cyanobacteria bacterium P01_G01_bin.38]
MVSQADGQASQNVSTPAILDCKTVLARLQKHYHTLKEFHIQSLALFGSVACNESTASSDLDFLVEFEGLANFDRYMDLKFFLEDLFERPVDLVTKRSLKPQISQTVLKEAIRVA